MEVIVFHGAKIVRMALGAKNKLVFIDGKLPKPPPKSDDYSK